jgi:hypothetical protein
MHDYLLIFLEKPTINSFDFYYPKEKTEYAIFSFIMKGIYLFQ